MPSEPTQSTSLWQADRPAEKLAEWRTLCDGFVPAYEEMLCGDGPDGQFTTTIHTRRLTPLGCAVQVFESQAFFETTGSDSGPALQGYLTFFCTETTDAVAQTPTSYFYQLYCNSGPHFEQIGRRILEHHAEHSSPLNPVNETLSGLYGGPHTALLHVTDFELREEWRGHRRLPALLRSVEQLRTEGRRHLIHPDNPYRRQQQPDEATCQDWGRRYDEEIAVQLAQSIGYLTITGGRAGNGSERLRDYIQSVAEDLTDFERPVLIVEPPETD